MLHEPLGAVLGAVAGIAHARGHHRLQVEGQALLRPAGDVMQVEAHGPEEIPGAADRPRLALHQQPTARALGPHQIGHFQRAEGVAGQPIQRLQVTKAAAAFLDMRLHHEGGFAIAGMAGGAFGALGGQKGAKAVSHAHLAEFGTEFVEGALIAGHEAGIDQRGLDRDVAPGMDQAILHAARRMADLQAEIPQQIEHELDQPLGPRADLGAGEEEQVDIRIGRQHAAAIAAGGDQGEGLLPRAGAARDHRLGIGVDGEDDGVHMTREPSRGTQTMGFPAFKSLLHTGLHRAQFTAQHAQRLITRQRRGVVQPRDERSLLGTDRRGWPAGGDRFGRCIPHDRIIKPLPRAAIGDFCSERLLCIRNGVVLHICHISAMW